MHTLQTAIVVSQIEVDVPRRRATHIAHFAFEPEIRIERVRFERLPKEADECSDRQQPGTSCPVAPASSEAHER